MQVKTDCLIQQEVAIELFSDAWTEPAQIVVTVEEGIVMLTGCVSGYSRKLAAQEAAHRVEGVLDVVNDIQVKADGEQSDLAIARDIRVALERAALVPHERIKSTVSDGWITLEGHVERLRQCDQAQHAVCAVTGVRGIYNKITVNWPRARAMSCGLASGTAQARQAAKAAL